MKLYLVESPEQLKEINQLCKTGSTMNVATVWSAARRKAGGKCPWDGKVMVSFYIEGGARIASVVRIDTSEQLNTVAWLKYTPALQWCRKNLNAVA